VWQVGYLPIQKSSWLNFNPFDDSGNKKATRKRKERVKKSKLFSGIESRVHIQKHMLFLNVISWLLFYFPGTFTPIAFTDYCFCPGGCFSRAYAAEVSLR
jgi:hypothetical protein